MTKWVQKKPNNTKYVTPQIESNQKYIYCSSFYVGPIK